MSSVVVENTKTLPSPAGYCNFPLHLTSQKSNLNTVKVTESSSEARNFAQRGRIGCPMFLIYHFLISKRPL